MINRIRGWLLLLCVCCAFGTGCEEMESGSGNGDSGLKKIVETTEAAPEKETSAPDSAAPAYSVFETTANLNVRAGAGTSHQVVYVTAKGEQLQMTGNQNQGKNGSVWYEIVVPSSGETGWVSGKYGIVKEASGEPANVEPGALEKENRVQKALAALRREEDKVSQVVYYKPKAYPRYSNERTFVLPYLATKGDAYQLHVVFNYYKSDRVFWNKIIFAVDDIRYEKKIGLFSTTQDVVSGGVVERYDMSKLSKREVELLRSIANSNETIIRFEGDDHRYDHTVSAADKKGIAEILEAYDSLDARNK